MDKTQEFKKIMEELGKLKFNEMYENDFFLTWEKTSDELKALIIEVNNSANERQQIIEAINSPISELDRPIRILKARLANNGKGE